MAVTDSRPYANAFLAANPTNIDGYQGGDPPVAYTSHHPDGPELRTASALILEMLQCDQTPISNEMCNAS